MQIYVQLSNEFVLKPGEVDEANLTKTHRDQPRPTPLSVLEYQMLVAKERDKINPISTG